MSESSAPPHTQATTGGVASHASAAAPSITRVATPASDPERQALAEFTPERRRYVRMREALALADPFVDIAIALLLLGSGFAARVRTVAERLPGGRYVRVLVTLGVLVLAATLLESPLAWFRDFHWEHRFGLSNQSFAAWAWEDVESALLAIALLGGTGLVAVGLWIVEKTGRAAFAWLGLLGLPVIVASVWVAPLVIEPAFNRFEPLRDPALTRRILALSGQAGVPARHVYEVDRSRQTNKLNAYVSGIGSSRRIVIWDTTLRALDPDALMFVVGHELGHDRLGHITRGVLLAAAGSFLLLFLVDRIVRGVVARFGARWGVRSPSDEAALPLVAAAAIVLLVLALPLTNAVSRRFEHEADAFGLDLTHANAAAARAFLVMGRENRSDPDPPAFIVWLLYTHPPLLERIRFALRHHPWETSG